MPFCDGNRRAGLFDLRPTVSFGPSLADIRLFENTGIRSILNASPTDRQMELSWSASHFGLRIVGSRCIQPKSVGALPVITPIERKVNNDDTFHERWA
jgi:hypothetical protein